MDVLDAIILGIIQGFTEFLPVSSSGHLELGKAILGDNSIPEESLLFTVILHFATALSTIVVFRKDIVEICTSLLQFSWNEETQFVSKIVISMLPAVVVGLLFEEELESFFGGNIAFVGFMLLLLRYFCGWQIDLKTLANQLPLKMPLLLGYLRR